MSTIIDLPILATEPPPLITFPQTFRIRQTFAAPRLDDVPAEVEAQLRRLDLGQWVRPGQNVAITAGSRGIANIAAILRAAADHIKRLEAHPFLVPAMGSHGGGTADGQLQLLRSYGITEQSVGCPIRSSMETVVVGETAEGLPIHFDRQAFEAEHVLVCGRVKPHSTFAGQFQSGLMKMLLVGLGKGAGASVYHNACHDYGFDRVVASAGPVVLDKCRILAGLAIVENAYDQTALVEALLPGQFEGREKQLLVLARQWLPQLPFRNVDVLLIDKIGKNISGVGFDANVVGRKFNDHRAVEGEFPKVKRICLRSLTAESHGNAIGIGMAEFCRAQLLAAADMAATRLNVLTSGHVSAAMRPLDYETDGEMLAAALGTIGLVRPAQARLLWIASTRELSEVECSAAYWEEAGRQTNLEIITALRDLPLDAAGNLREQG
ncbi:MAG: lactate racemase domain-containing protein [Thermoguttaceae bacterium]|jgi:hypothetical protein